MQPGDLYAEAMDLAEENERLIRLLQSSGIKLAQNDTAYRKELSKAELQMNAEGYPVTITRDTCRGLPEIAKLRLRRDCSKAVYEATLQAIQANKLKMRLLEAQNAREWAQVGGNYS